MDQRVKLNALPIHRWDLQKASLTDTVDVWSAFPNSRQHIKRWKHTQGDSITAPTTAYRKKKEPVHMKFCHHSSSSSAWSPTLVQYVNKSWLIERAKSMALHTPACIIARTGNYFWSTKWKSSLEEKKGCFPTRACAYFAWRWNTHHQTCRLRHDGSEMWHKPGESSTQRDARAAVLRDYWKASAVNSHTGALRVHRSAGSCCLSSWNASASWLMSRVYLYWSYWCRVGHNVLLDLTYGGSWLPLKSQIYLDERICPH